MTNPLSAVCCDRASVFSGCVGGTGPLYSDLTQADVLSECCGIQWQNTRPYGEARSSCTRCVF